MTFDQEMERAVVAEAAAQGFAAYKDVAIHDDEKIGVVMRFNVGERLGGIAFALPPDNKRTPQEIARVLVTRAKAYIARAEAEKI